MYSQETNDSQYVIRQSIGGAGYSAWSGIPRQIEDYSPVVTYEGDNTVMAQQSLNFLLKLAKKARQGKNVSKLDGVFAYLEQMDNLLQKKCTISEPHHFLDLD